MKTILVDAVNTFINKDGVNNAMHKMLEEFDNPKMIVTNANEEQMKSFGIVDMPYIVFTLEHEPNKTDPEYFKKMMEKFSLTPNELIYFEHNMAAVDSAQLLGIVSYWYDSETNDLDSLKIFIENNL